MTRFPTPHTKNPVSLPDGTAIPSNVFLKAVVDHPKIDVGDYTYASDFDPPSEPGGWAARIAPFMFPISQDRLIIGKFGQFAHGVRFITNSANHKMDGFSTYPFAIHQPERFMAYPGTLPRGRDTVVGHDVWIGMDAKIMPGTTIGNGVIVGAGAVVSGQVPDYAVVAGNRAKIVRMRFDPETIKVLNEIAWWDWDIDKILDHEEAITGSDIAGLLAASETS